MRKEKNFYAVVIGRKPDVYNSWEACKCQVDGFSGAKFRGFEDYHEAIQWLRSFREKPKVTNANKFVYIAEDDTWGDSPLCEKDDIYISLDWIIDNIILSKKQKFKILKGL